MNYNYIGFIFLIIAAFLIGQNHPNSKLINSIAAECEWKIIKQDQTKIKIEGLEKVNGDLAEFYGLPRQYLNPSFNAIATKVKADSLDCIRKGNY